MTEHNRNPDPTAGMPPLFSRAAEEFAKLIADTPAMHALTNRMSTQIPEVTPSVFDDQTMTRIRHFAWHAAQRAEVRLNGQAPAATASFQVQVEGPGTEVDKAAPMGVPHGDDLPEWAGQLMANSPAKVIAVSAQLYTLLRELLRDFSPSSGPDAAAMWTLVWVMAWVVATEAYRNRP